MSAAKPRNGGPRPRIDWGAAFAFFLALGPTRSYGAVAREYGVSEGAVRKHAKAEDWELRVAKVDAEARRRAEERAVRSLEERQRDTIRVAERLRGLALTEELDPNVAVRALPRYAQLEQLFAGEATDRIEVAEAQRLLDTHHEVALRFVPPERQAEFLSELERALVGREVTEAA